jgi:hypothetical protein
MLINSGRGPQNTQRSFGPSVLFRRAMRNALRFFDMVCSMMWGRGLGNLAQFLDRRAQVAPKHVASQPPRLHAAPPRAGGDAAARGSAGTSAGKADRRVAMQ